MKSLPATALLLISLGVLIFARTINSERNSSPITTPKPSSTTKQPSLLGALPFHTVLWTEFGHAQIGVTEINDPGTWSAFWNQNCTQAEGLRQAGYCPPLPQIDFASRTVLVISPGLQGNPGFQINVTRVTSEPGNLLVDATLTTPGPYCIWIQVIAFPVHVIDISKTDLPPSLNMIRAEAPACPY